MISVGINTEHSTLNNSLLSAALITSFHIYDMDMKSLILFIQFYHALAKLLDLFD